MKVLSFPVAINSAKEGFFVTIEQGSDEYKAQQIAAFANTVRGERPVFQEFGIEDPTFGKFDKTEFSAEFAMFYPDIALMDVRVAEERGAVTNIFIEFAT